MIHGGDLEPVTRRSSANAARVQLIIHALSDRFTSETFPAMSTHHHSEVPGVIGGVVLPHEYTAEEFVLPYQPSPIVIEDIRTGFDESGNYHCPSLRIEHTYGQG